MTGAVRHRPHRSPAMRVVALALTMSAILPAITGCETAETNPRSTTTPAGSLSSAQEQVKRDYLAYWDAMLRASATSDAEATGLADHAAGQQLTRARRNLSVARADGIVARGNVDHQIRDVTIDNALAHIVDCVDTRKWLQYDAATGELRRGQLTEHPKELGRFVLAPREGTWFVTDIQELGGC